MESESGLRSRSGSDPDFHLLIDRTFTCVQAGPPGARPLGIDISLIEGHPLSALGLSPALADRLEAQTAAVFATGLPLTRHLTVLTLGELRDYALSFSPVFGLDAAVVYVACLGREITDMASTPLVFVDAIANAPDPDILTDSELGYDPADSTDEPSSDPAQGQSDDLSALMGTVATSLDIGILILDANGHARAINPEAAHLLDVGQHGVDTAQVFAPGSPFYSEDGSPLALADLPWGTTGRTRVDTPALIGRKVSALAFIWISVALKTITNPRRPAELLTLVSLRDVTQQRRTESQYLRQIANAERRSVVVDARNNHLSQTNQQLARQNEALGTLATHDGLTTLKNHQAFQERLREETRRAMRSKEPLSLLILDVDYFKRFNDDYGHPAGDRMLRNVAETMLQTARATDLVARYGGEEFAIILPETDADGAFIIAERIRVAVETRLWDDRAVTVSIGVSTLRLDEIDSGNEWKYALLPKQLIEEADRAMYKSKRGGRNRVTAYVAESQSPLWLLSAGDTSNEAAEVPAENSD